MIETLTVSWFSGGVSSAVATKLMLPDVDKVIYFHVDDQHEDTLRFLRDCEAWFGVPIEIMQSPLLCVDNACRQIAYVNGPHGAGCTRLLKRRVRQEWEAENRFFNRFRYVWGMDSGEPARMDRLRVSMPEDEHSFPLADRSITKADAHGILKRAGIKRPAMYDMGYPNNNCKGCVKGGMGYWNKIRSDFPAVFAQRCKMEKDIGGTCINGVSLSNLSPTAGRNKPVVVEECGAMCEAAGVLP